MPKIGRNSPCPCNSGKKYKHCCGFGAQSPTAATGEPSAEAFRLMQVETARHGAKEYRRRLMQGLGRPIISVEYQGYRLVAVGSALHWGKTWRTFHDFLFAYIRTVFTPEWGTISCGPEGRWPTSAQDSRVRVRTCPKGCQAAGISRHLPWGHVC